jgi:NTE family protein
MLDQMLDKSHKSRKRPPFECVALLLQGGGALGSYQGGVYQALAEADLHPDWIAGVSIGAVNAALIAGNPPEKRVESLRTFWQEITTAFPWDQPDDSESPIFQKGTMRHFANKMSAASAMVNGVANFYVPRILTPWLHRRGSLDATSYYDTAKLKATLERLIDFDRINSGKPRFSAGAVNVKTGDLVYFDTTTHTIGPEHIMASAALPPGFPAVEIEGEYYWDGGLVSNTPLQWVVESRPRFDMLAFQVDLWNADGAFPRDMTEVTTRQKEILFSSRTRANTDRFKYAQKLHHAFANFFDKLPDGSKNTPEAKLLGSFADRKVYNIVHLIYHTRNYEGSGKDYEFSRISMEDHWQEGYRATVRTLGHPEILERPGNTEGIAIFDFSREDPMAEINMQEAAE